MTRAKWSAERERVFKAAMRVRRYYAGRMFASLSVPVHMLIEACIAAAKAKKKHAKD